MLVQFYTIKNLCSITCLVLGDIKISYKFDIQIQKARLERSKRVLGIGETKSDRKNKKLPKRFLTTKAHSYFNKWHILWTMMG